MNAANPPSTSDLMDCIDPERSSRNTSRVRSGFDMVWSFQSGIRSAAFELHGLGVGRRCRRWCDPGLPVTTGAYDAFGVDPTVGGVAGQLRRGGQARADRVLGQPDLLRRRAKRQLRVDDGVGQSLVDEPANIVEHRPKVRECSCRVGFFGAGELRFDACVPVGHTSPYRSNCGYARNADSHDMRLVVGAWRYLADHD